MVMNVDDPQPETSMSCSHHHHGYEGVGAVRTDEDEAAGEQPVDAWPLVAAEGREGQLEPLASASLGEAGPAVGGVRKRH